MVCLFLVKWWTSGSFTFLFLIFDRCSVFFYIMMYLSLLHILFYYILCKIYHIQGCYPCMMDFLRPEYFLYLRFHFCLYQYICTLYMCFYRFQCPLMYLQSLCVYSGLKCQSSLHPSKTYDRCFRKYFFHFFWIMKYM